MFPVEAYGKSKVLSSEGREVVEGRAGFVEWEERKVFHRGMRVINFLVYLNSCSGETLSLIHISEPTRPY